MSFLTRLPRFGQFILLGLATIGLILTLRQLPISAILQTALGWVDGWGLWAPIGFILLYNIATVLLLPGAVLTLGGGVLFGLWWGTAYVILAATLGATFAFLIGRHFARAWVIEKVQTHPQFRAIDRAVAQQGFKIVLLTRLSPIFPFNLLNYAFGVTQVSLKDYVLGSFGMIPGTILYVYIGSLVGSLAMLNMPTTHNADPQVQMWLWASKIVGLIATIGVTVYVTRIAKATLDDSLE
jgi:uncharacterized membrane protein YdjX (TVP38/TMEM64 family)